MFEVSRPKFGTRLAYLSIVLSAFFAASCGSSAPSVSDPTGQQAIIDIANNDLTSGDCGDALTDILPLYNSSYSSNSARLVTASAYGCDAEINFFAVITNLGLDADTFVSANTLGYLAQIFPSTTADKVVESAGFGMNVLLTTLSPGEVIAPADSINATSYNPGSLLSSDRIADSNLYMLMMSMATLGGAASRYSTTGYHPANSGTPFPWVNNTTAMTTEGCTVAAATQNFVDVLDDEIKVLGGSSTAQLTQIASVVTQSALDLVCEEACKGVLPTGCTLTTCGNNGHCPLGLHDWTQCKVNDPTDPVGCAAAGVISLLNTNPVWK